MNNSVYLPPESKIDQEFGGTRGTSGLFRASLFLIMSINIFMVLIYVASGIFGFGEERQLTSLIEMIYEYIRLALYLADIYAVWLLFRLGRKGLFIIALTSTIYALGAFTIAILVYDGAVFYNGDIIIFLATALLLPMVDVFVIFLLGRKQIQFNNNHVA